MTQKYFTIEEANGLLPYVGQEITFLQKSKYLFEYKYQELRNFQYDNLHLAHTDPYKDTVFKLECALEFVEMEFHMHIKSLQDKGIQIKGIEFGLVDFPAIIDGEEVLLCWKQGEDCIRHYHSADDGFSGRKRIE